jgi:hypothetical protein
MSSAVLIGRFWTTPAGQPTYALRPLPTFVDLH